MKKSFRIFRRDLSRLMHNRAAILVTIGVCLLPSLYAWFNIAANIDPYGNTSGIKIAVANNDTQATDQDITINAGQEILDNLKENKQLGWVFTSEKKAVDGVKSGKYYAAIVIPKDFSSSLLSILSGNLKTPELDYYINEKVNAIAPKITSSGASTIQEEINSTFSAVASESVSSILKESAGKLSNTLGTVNSNVIAMLNKTENNLASYEKILLTSSSDTASAQSSIANAAKTSESLKNSATSGASALENSISILKDARSAAGDFSSALSSSVSQGENLLGQASSSISSGLDSLESKAQSVNNSIGNALDAANSVTELNGKILADLEELSSFLPDKITESIQKLQAQNQSNQELVNSLTAGNKGISDAISTASTSRKEIAGIASDSIDSLHTFRSTLDQNVLPQLNQTLDLFSSVTGELTGLLNGVPATADQMNGILSQLEKSLKSTNEALDGTKTALQNVQGHIDTIQTDINALASSDAFQTLLSLEGVDDKSVASFMSSPVEIQTERLYPVKNYGSSMTPFYTNLAIWVGGIVLIAIFKMEVDKDHSMRNYGSVSLYFGRWLLYVTVGVVQGIIVTAGDIFLPGVQCTNPAALILTGAVCSFVYVNIIYALSLTFKHIGKALCVILVILQIPGSSGTYPIEMTPAFFQNLHPLLPFTYGITAMRECIAGMYGSTYIHNLLILLLYVPISLLIGLGIRPLLSGLNRLFDQKLAETELMIGETPTEVVGKKLQLSMLLSASLSQEELQIQTASKAQAFEKNYQKMIKIGFLAILIVPLIFLILMFSLESKLVFLVLWILSIILIATWLIIVEYFHSAFANQQKLAGMSFNEMLESFRKKEEE